MTKVTSRLTKFKHKAQLYAGYAVDAIYSVTAKKALYKNQDFRLVYVKKAQDGSVSMSIVTPALDRHTRKQVEAMGYCTVSHLWGTKESWKPWTSHGILGTNGEILSVNLRPEKQDTLLQLLRAYPGFWWIDVFCAQSDTPLGIMGSVYLLCNRCFALVDFPPSEFAKVNDIVVRLKSLTEEVNFGEEYKQRIDGKMGHEDLSWHDILDDLLGGWYGSSSSSSSNDEPDNDIMILADFFECQWFTRVWTLQEFVLPRCFTFLSECGSVKTTLDRTTFGALISNLSTVVTLAMEPYIIETFGEHPMSAHLGFTKEQHLYASRTPGASRCYFTMTQLTAFFLYQFFGNGSDGLPRFCNMRHVSSKLDLLGIFLTLLGRMPRTCMDPCDYIYGVVGLLDMDIPRMTDQYKVWSAFREMVLKRAPHLTIPEQFDLSKVVDMRDVYKIFLVEDFSEVIVNIADITF